MHRQWLSRNFPLIIDALIMTVLIIGCIEAFMGYTPDFLHPFVDSTNHTPVIVIYGTVASIGMAVCVLSHIVTFYMASNSQLFHKNAVGNDARLHIASMTSASLYGMLFGVVSTLLVLYGAESYAVYLSLTAVLFITHALVRSLQWVYDASSSITEHNEEGSKL